MTSRSGYKTERAEIRGQHLELHPLRALYWEEADSLVIADPHFGKIGHFRKQGIAVPLAVAEKNFRNLEALLSHYRPSQLVFLGDLFHDQHNREWDTFRKILDRYPLTRRLLITGNHDILHPDLYRDSGLQTSGRLEMGPFLFSHDEIPLPPGPHPHTQGPPYLLHGHIHPSVSLRGPARQKLRIPCFLFGRDRAILPAFGSFTGTFPVKAGPEDKVYLVADSKIIPKEKK